MVRLVWATGGRTWGFRFLLDGGYRDPLPIYERAFTGLRGETEAHQRVHDMVALRFPDPLSRKDAAGRVIPHDFVALEPLSKQIRSVDDGLRTIWPVVEAAYEQVWDNERSPSAATIRDFFN